MDEKTANQGEQVNQPEVMDLTKPFEQMNVNEMKAFLDKQGEVIVDEGQGQGTILGQDETHEEVKPQTEEKATAETGKRRLKIKTDGDEHEIEYDDTDLVTVFQKAYFADKQDNFYKKNKALINKFEKAGLSDGDVDMLMKLKNGDKSAYASLMKANNIDALDLDIENATAYVKEEYQAVKLNAEVEKKFRRIENTNPDIAERIVKAQEELPAEVLYAIADNETAYRDANRAYSHFDILTIQIGNGSFDTVSREVNHLLATKPQLRTKIALDPTEYWSVYNQVGVSMGLFGQNQTQQPQAQQKPNENLLEKAQASASMTPPKGAMPTTDTGKAQTFEEWMDTRGSKLDPKTFREEAIRLGFN